MRKPGPFYTETLIQGDQTIRFYFTGRLRRYKWKIAHRLMRVILSLAEADYMEEITDRRKGDDVKTIWPRHVGN